jgi:hypothetical protein
MKQLEYTVPQILTTYAGTARSKEFCKDFKVARELLVYTHFPKATHKLVTHLHKLFLQCNFNSKDAMAARGCSLLISLV